MTHSTRPRTSDIPDAIARSATPSAAQYAIVGGGLLGMTMALRLAEQGRRVTLFEASDRLGGLADAWELGDITWDRHYHVTLLSDLRLRGVLTELNLEHDMQWVETKTGFFTDGQLYSMSNSVEFLRFPPLRLIDKLRLGGTIFYASKINNWQRLEQIPVADWLRRLSGRRAFERIWLPLLRAKLGENYQHTSAAFIWATIARMYAARRTGLKKEMFGYLPGGYARIIRAFEQRLRDVGVNVRLNARIDSVEGAESDNKLSNSCRPSITLDDGAIDLFDRIVLTCPSPVVSRLCSGLTAAEHARHNGIRYQGIVCASVLLKNPLDRFYVTNITDDWVPFTAVIEMTTLVDPAEFGGRSLIYLPKYVSPDDPLFEVSDDDLRERFLAALERMYPHFRRDEVLAFRVSRVRNVVGLTTLDYSANLPPVTTSIPGVYAINSAQIVNGTLNVNETVRLAEDSVAHVLLPHDEGGELVEGQRQLTDRRQPAAVCPG